MRTLPSLPDRLLRKELTRGNHLALQSSGGGHGCQGSEGRPPALSTPCRPQGTPTWVRLPDRPGEELSSRPMWPLCLRRTRSRAQRDASAPGATRVPCGPPSTERANTRRGKLSNTGDRVGTRTQQPGRRDIGSGGRGPGEEQRRADGGWRDRGGGVPSGGQSAAPHARQLARGWAVSTAAFSSSPALPWPDPYLTLVRPLRSVHLLDVSIQVIGPGRERTKTDFKIRPPKMRPRSWPGPPTPPAP